MKNIILLIGLLGAQMALAAGPVELSWREKFLADFKELQGLFSTYHPITFDMDPPPSKGWVNLDIAYWDTWKIDSESAYYWALRHYSNGLQDPHTGISVNNSDRRYKIWPGFFTVYRNSHFEVASDAQVGPHIPPAGSVLENCEGRTPEEMLAANILRFNYATGTNPTATWLKVAPFLLIKSDNPFVSWPDICQFRLPDSQVVSIPLQWRDLSNEEWNAFLDHLYGSRFDTAFGLEEVTGGNSYWLDMHDFAYSEESNAQAESVKQSVKSLKIPERIHDIDYLVFDLRGNLGGTVSAALDIVNAIFGDRFADHLMLLPPMDMGLGRIASPMALAIYADPPAGADYPPEALRYFADQRKKIQQALESNTFYDSGFYKPEEPNPDFVASLQRLPKVYVLIDQHCVSACLIVADVLRNYPKSKFVGTPSGYDQPYMEVGPPVPLSSGRIALSMPQTIIFERRRGHNESIVPDYPMEFEGRSRQDLFKEIESLNQKVK